MGRGERKRERGERERDIYIFIKLARARIIFFYIVVFLHYFMIKQKTHQVGESVALNSLLFISSSFRHSSSPFSMIHNLEGLKDGQDTGLLCMCFIGLQT